MQPKHKTRARSLIALIAELLSCSAVLATESLPSVAGDEHHDIRYPFAWAPRSGHAMVYDAARERVVVYGGGNTAIDVARTAKRLGATESIIVYRRTRDRMPAHDFEVEEALPQVKRRKRAPTCSARPRADAAPAGDRIGATMLLIAPCA